MCIVKSDITGYRITSAYRYDDRTFQLIQATGWLSSAAPLSTAPEKNFPGIFTVEILLEWMESLKRGKSAVLRKLGRTETGYFSRRSQFSSSTSSLQIELWARGEKGRVWD